MTAVVTIIIANVTYVHIYIYKRMLWCIYDMCIGIVCIMYYVLCIIIRVLCVIYIYVYIHIYAYPIHLSHIDRRP